MINRVWPSGVDKAIECWQSSFKVPVGQLITWMRYNAVFLIASRNIVEECFRLAHCWTLPWHFKYFIYYHLQNRLGKGGTLTAEDHKFEVVGRFERLGTVIYDSNDETEEIRARILAANKAYVSLQTTFRSNQIYRNNKIRLYKTLINTLTPNDPCRGRTASLTSKLCILYIYSTKIGTGYFKHGIYSFFLFKM